MIQWFNDRSSFDEAIKHLQAMATTVEQRLANGPKRTEGYCCTCDKVVQFNIERDGDSWVNLRECIVCPVCRLNGRMRLIVTGIRQANRRSANEFRILERITPLFAYLKAEYPNLRGCEYIADDLPSGSIRSVHGTEVEHQDLLHLSYPNGSIDLLVHGDVLEHVPDHHRALAEAARVIKPEGQMIFTCPFFNYFDSNLIRCRIENGELKHYEPPAYHGNPMSEKGSLVFIHPGWQLMDDIKNAGFASAEIGLYYDPYQGFVSNYNPYPSGHMWPVIFRAVR